MAGVSLGQRRAALCRSVTVVCLDDACVYHLFRAKPYIDNMTELVDSLTTSGLV